MSKKLGLDAGHGGNTPGKLACNGSLTWSLVAYFSSVSHIVCNIYRTNSVQSSAPFEHTIAA